MRRPLHNTTKLPRQLADELAIDDVHHGAGKKRPPGSRKDRRKAERVQKKAQRRQTHTQISQPPSARKQQSQLTRNAGEATISRKRPAEPVKGVVAPLKSILKKSKPAQHDTGRHGSLDFDSPPPLIPKGVRDKLAQDDAEIAALEKRLGMKKKKATINEDDGLDDLLKELDGQDSEECRKDGKRKRTKEEEWLVRKRMKAQGKVEQEDTQVIEAQDEDEDEYDDMLSTASDGFQSEDASDSEEHFLTSGSDEGTIVSKPATKARENPYIPPTSASSKEARAKYIPPSLRNPSSSERDSLSRLRRQTQGILNRLSESNLVSILGEVEQLYAHHPRQHVTSTLVDLLIGVVCDQASLLDSFIILHAGLAAGIYRIIGVDFGAALVHRVVEEFDKVYVTDIKGSERSAATDGGKKTLNLISLLAELYNLQMVGSHLVFDLIRFFLNEISEINTELLLRIIRSSGPQLRQDDASAVKDVVLLLQREISKLGEGHLSVRTKFMIETINDLKNNRLKTGAGASSVRSQSLVNMKKTLGSLNSRKLQATEPLRIGLRDIRNADKKGKWWLVGASWTKDNDGNSEDLSKQTRTKNENRTDQQVEDLNPLDTDLLRLAREQKMNTDIRRAIFITIMSAADYQDAYLRLTKLRLKRAQELEIPRVVIHCARAEQAYNPYYTLIARRLCADRKLKMAFQFSLWGLFKAMGERGDDEDAMDADLGDDEEEEDEEDNDGAVGMRKIVNTAKMFGSLIVEGGLELNILKILNFAYLQPKTKTFIELLLITVILLSQRPQPGTTTTTTTQKKRDEDPLVAIFAKVKDNPSLARGLHFFLKTVVAKTDVAGGKSEKNTVRWGCRVAGDVLAGIVASVVVVAE